MSFGRRILVWVAAVVFGLVACLSLSGTFESQRTGSQVTGHPTRGNSGNSIELAGQALVVRAATDHRQAHPWRILLGVGLAGTAIAWALVSQRARYGAESGELVLWRVTGQRDRAPPALI